MTMISQSKLSKKIFVPLLITALLSTLLVGYTRSVRAEAAAPVLPTFDIPALSQEHKASALPNVIVVATGGTLAGQVRNNDPTNFQSYAAGTYKIADMVAQLPKKDKIADVSTFQFGNKGSGGYSMKELYDLSLAVDAALEIYDSAVVTTGTDTMEEIAYFLDLTVQSEKPVVVTGAMRPWDAIGTDGPANLYQAIKVAGSGKTKWYGTVVMLNDVIHAAREVTKSNSHRMDTFETPMFGALGYVDDPAVRIYRLNARALKAGDADWATPFNLRTISKESLPKVEIVYSYQEAGGGAIRASVEDGAKGIVTAGTGAAGISSKMSAARSAAIKDHGVTFVSTTRTGSGTITGGGSGIIAGDNLNPQHARIMLMLSLAFSNDFNTVKNWFETVGTQDITLDVAETPTVPGDDGGSGDTGTNSGHVTIGAGSAGTLGLDDIVTVSVPAGATKEQMQLSITKLTGTGGIVESTSQLVSPIFEIIKTISSNFLVPVTLTFKFDPALIKEGKVASIFYYDDAKKQWIEMGGTVSGSTIAVKTDHFTKFAVFAVDKAGTAFTDISGHWAEAAIKEAIASGIVKGYTDGTFKPNNTVTRAEFSVMLMGALKAEGEGAALTFTDQAKIAAWAKEAVAHAVKAEIISGYPDGTFRPGANILRMEMVSMIAKGAGLTLDPNAATSFADNEDIPAWAMGAVKAVSDKGIIQGRTGNVFTPKATASRADAITVIMNMLKK
ncbi:asparaginase domain-containing protein [Paenibacillus sp. LHD-38]|uniref:asparaginase domain-containing protein n=1 Tax=Paenibacillus sp. LHD-38 TaxID=3072143 RepID=UPI00280F7B1F|nr:asparaginase domain-containing protein [Paenibacillus sp. LHD-38]MDQ8734946.1 asparaginase domain-containing protein [Paenibacillus sp. LHD-38]